MGIGVSSFDTKGDGVWYQDSNPHGLHLYVPVVTLGFSYPLLTRGQWGIDARADVDWLGTVSANCECDTNDADYSDHKPDAPKAIFSGHGSVAGLALTVEPYYVTHGFRLAAEAGLFPYLWHWSETVNGWYTQPGMTPHFVTANSGRTFSVGEVVGVSVSRGPLTVAYRHYFLSTQGAHGVPPVWSGADMVEVKYQF